MKPDKQPRAKTTAALPILNPHAAGIDVGANELYVAVPKDCAQPCVRVFETFTSDLNALADWLRECGIQTVAMESTGVYWIPLFQILEARGLEVCLVNARHLQHVGARKTDVCDCQWLQYLHACGLLRASFRPPQQVCAVRSLLRHRDTLVTYAASHVQHMHKALTQMNVQLHHVLSDLTGKTGLAILDALLAGERDPETLAALRDFRIKASPEVIAKSLVGDYRPEHLFALKQALSAYRYYQQLLAECDQEIERLLECFDTHPSAVGKSLPSSTAPNKQPRGHEIRFQNTDLRTQMARILGQDLTQIPGLQAATVHTLFTELGSDLSAFPTVKHFVSWLGLCPDKRLSGGKVLGSKTRKVASRAARALRMAAQSLAHSYSALGDYFRRMRARLGAPQAITATAHKLARILYHLLRTGQPYDASVFVQDEQRSRKRREQRLLREAAALGYKLVSETPVS